MLSASATLYVDPVSGSDLNSGAADKPLKTINKALSKAQPGTQVLLRSGVYKEAVKSVRGGTSLEPIVITAAPNASPIIDGGTKLNGMYIAHSYIHVRGLEIRNMNIGIRVQKATGVVFENNEIHHFQSECLKVSNFSTHNVVRDNLIHDCGLSANGEGIYIGTAPEQRAKIGGSPDATLYNLIEGNELYNVDEGVDIKEDSSFNTVRLNYVHGAYDPDSGAFNIRGDRNTIESNRAELNDGSGFRAGGDLAINSSGDLHQYGKNNIFRHNISKMNAQYGYKLIQTPQDLDCTNTAEQNTRAAYNSGLSCETASR